MNRAISLTSQGFGVYAEFEDTHGSTVTVQESSAAEYEAVWIFCDGDGTYTAPHLNLEQAKAVRDGLDAWVKDVEGEI